MREREREKSQIELKIITNTSYLSQKEISLFNDIYYFIVFHCQICSAYLRDDIDRFSSEK